MDGLEHLLELDKLFVFRGRFHMLDVANALSHFEGRVAIALGLLLLHCRLYLVKELTQTHLTTTWSLRCKMCRLNATSSLGSLYGELTARSD